jgi:Na+-translocating ferredoxin:NAD+ oxidoreductase RnfC subunit
MGGLKQVKNEVAELAYWAGVVGAGGAGFPTHVKLDVEVDMVVVNGAECEPLLSVDYHLMVNYPSQLAAMLEKVRCAVQAVKAVFAVKAKNKEAVVALQRATASYPDLQVVQLGDFYPAGDEFVLVYEALGNRVPPGGIPLAIKTVVLNVETLWNLAEGEAKRPVTGKWVTVAGAVGQPGTYHVPLGVRVKDLLSLAGGPSIADYKVLAGGPLMGELVKDLEQPVTKTTKGIVVLPGVSPVVTIRSMPLPHILRQARAVCCQCRECTELCPRNHLGHYLEPHKMMLLVSYPGYEPQAAAEAFLCSECGVCDLYACPMGLSPRRVNQALKKELRDKGLRNPYKDIQKKVHPWREFRRVPVTRLLKRLGLENYHRQPPLREITIAPAQVTLPLKQHTGVAAVPVVQVGQRVLEGDLVAEIPAGSLGARLHASITGEVAAVTLDSISIVAEKGKEVADNG